MRIVQVIIIFFAITLQTPLAFALDGLERIYARMFTSQSNENIKLAATYLYHYPSKNTELLDLPAKILDDAIDSGNLNDDDMAWLAKSLGASKDNRYYTILKKATDSKYPKLKKYAKPYLKKLSKPSEKSFNSKSINLAQLNKNLMKGLTKTNKEGFYKVRTGASINDAIALAGDPNSIIITRQTRNRHWGVYISYAHITLSYTDKGEMRLIHPIDKKKTLTIDRITAAASANGSQGYSSGILSADPGLIRDTAKKMYKAHVKDPAIIKKILLTLRKNINTDDKITVDAMAWLCKVIGQTKNPKYYDALMDISLTANHRKVKKYAKKSAKQLK